MNPYNYCQCNPVNRVDPDGALDVDPPENNKIIEKIERKIKIEESSFSCLYSLKFLVIDTIDILSNIISNKQENCKLNTYHNASDNIDKNIVESNKKDVKYLNVSQKGIDFIKDYEKFKKKLYNDATGNATIGYGSLVHKGKVGTDTLSEKNYKKGITHKDAENLLKQDIITKAERFIKGNVTVDISQNQFDALVALTFNIGGGGLKSSTLLKKINAKEREIAVITKSFKLWNKGTINGKLIELKGLTTRRVQEADMYNKNVYNSKH